MGQESIGRRQGKGDGQNQTEEEAQGLGAREFRRPLLQEGRHAFREIRIAPHIALRPALGRQLLFPIVVERLPGKLAKMSLLDHYSFIGGDTNFPISRKQLGLG